MVRASGACERAGAQAEPATICFFEAYTEPSAEKSEMAAPRGRPLLFFHDGCGVLRSIVFATRRRAASSPVPLQDPSP